jgi:hypothetical protein
MLVREILQGGGLERFKIMETGTGTRTCYLKCDRHHLPSVIVTHGVSTFMLDIQNSSEARPKLFLRKSRPTGDPHRDEHLSVFTDHRIQFLSNSLSRECRHNLEMYQ